MATTPNYGWTTPDDTNLVKNGASDIRTLANAIDATTKSINDIASAAETTANGAIPKSVVDASGDLIVATAADTVTRLAAGTNGQVLTITAGVPAWSAPGGGSPKAINKFTSSGTYTVPTGCTYAYIIAVGGGGGGGGGTSQTSGPGGGGGGGGAIATVWAAVTAGATHTVTIGAAGGGGGSAGTSGSAGGTTSVGSLITAIGGGGGLSGSAGTTAGLAGGDGGGNPGLGGLPTGGGNGGAGFALDSVKASRGGPTNERAGAPGGGYGGGGGGGGYGAGSSGGTGGAGAAGLVLIYSY